MHHSKVVNLFKEPFDVYIGRAGKGKDGYFGNPIVLKPDEERGSTIEKFKRRVHELQGKTLGCFCKPKACHGDVYIEYLNNLKE